MSAREEALITMQDGLLANDKVMLRNKAKDILLFENEKAANLQNLFVHSDQNKYEETKKQLETKLELERRNLKFVLGSIVSADFDKLWDEALAMLAPINELEKTILAGWQANRELSAQLTATGEQIQRDLLNIVNLTRSTIADNMQFGERASLATGIGTAILLLLTSY